MEHYGTRPPLCFCPGMCLRALSPEWDQGSGYEQAEAEFSRVEADEAAVALGPLA